MTLLWWGVMLRINRPAVEIRSTHHVTSFCASPKHTNAGARFIQARSHHLRSLQAHRCGSALLSSAHSSSKRALQSSAPSARWNSTMCASLKRALQSRACNHQRQWRFQLLTNILIGLSFMLGVRSFFLIGSLVSHCSHWLVGLLSSDW